LRASRPAPLPVNVPLTALPVLGRVSGAEYVPSRRASGTVPEVRLAALSVVRFAGSVKLLNSAYGAAVSGWRGASVVYVPPPAGRTSTCTQRAWPAKAAGPKSSTDVKSPCATTTPFAANGAPIALPPVAASKRVKRKS
jgi:hypothetical protein